MVNNNRNDHANQSEVFTLEPPAVQVGDWIDAGWYRPAQVLIMEPEPPHRMTITYGDEIDDNFYPHIVQWGKVCAPKRLKSLKDVFVIGDWVRHLFNGEGQVLGVRNVSLEIKFGEDEGRYFPNRNLSDFKKIKGPAPVDDRPIAEQFPPGTWIEQYYVGKGVVLYVEGEILTVYGTKKCARIIADGVPANVFKGDEPPMDLSRSFERRRLWLWRYKYLHAVDLWPCACCGYPEFRVPSKSWEGLGHCIICGWINTLFSAREVYPKTLEEAYEPIVDKDIFDAQAWPNKPHSLVSAKITFENSGIMFRADDTLHDFFSDALAMRKEFRCCYDKIILKDPNSETLEDLDQLHTLAKEIIEGLSSSR